MELIIFTMLGWTAALLLGLFLCAAVAIFGLNNNKSLSPDGRAVLVTGCDTGLGHALARHLDTLGCTVFAGCLYEDGPGAQSLKKNTSVHVVQMDVTKDAQIFKVRDYIQKITEGDLWAVVNNAGLNIMGEIELCTMEQFKRTIDINILGMVRVTKTFLPLMRKSKGRFVNVTSVKGRLSTHANGAYNITKFGGETFSDILRLELKKWGVDVVIIEPGNFGGATGCLEMTRIKQDHEDMWDCMDEEVRQAYGRSYLDYGWQEAEAAIPSGDVDITPVIDSMVDALFKVKPHSRYLIPGGSGIYDVYKWLIYMSPFIPTSLLDRLTEYVFVSGWPKPAALQKK